MIIHISTETRREVPPDWVVSNEDLKLVASAAGYDLEWKICSCKAGLVEAPFIDNSIPWQPATDDAASRKLEVLFRLHVLHNDPTESTLYVNAFRNSDAYGALVEFANESERGKATCLAILLAAVAIGRASK